MTYPFEWAIGMLKAGMPVRRRSWVPHRFVTTLRRMDLICNMPRIPRDWPLLAKAGQYPEVVKVDSKRLVGFVLVDRDDQNMNPYCPTYDDMVAEDWDRAYGS